MLSEIRARHAAELQAHIDKLFARIKIPGATPWIAHDSDSVSLTVNDYDAFHAWRTAQDITLTVRPYRLTFEHDGITYRASTLGLLPNVLQKIKNANARTAANRYHALTTADILAAYPTATGIVLHPNNDYTFKLGAK
jgi:hypothetical protein